MNDERLLWLIKANSGLENPEVLVAALRAEGFDLYRPDDCEKLIALPPGWTGSNPFVSKPGTYRLVPVGGEG